MIFGVGVDLCDIPRYLRISKKFQGNFEKRLFTSEEQHFWKQYGKALPENLAIMFAGKEAMIKALGESLRNQSYGYHDFHFFFQPVTPLLKLSDRLTEKLFKNSKPVLIANCSKTNEYAVVTVIIEV